MTTVDGKPAKGRDLEARDMTLRDDRIHMEFGEGQPVLVAQRR